MFGGRRNYLMELRWWCRKCGALGVEVWTGAWVCPGCGGDRVWDTFDLRGRLYVWQGRRQTAMDVCVH